MFIRVIILTGLVCCEGIFCRDLLTSTKNDILFHKSQRQSSLDALCAMILKLRWQNFVILVDDTTFDLSLDLIRKLNVQGQMGMILNIDHSARTLKFFNDHSKSYHNFLMFCDKKSTIENLKIILNHQVALVHFSWVIMIPEEFVNWHEVIHEMKVVRTLRLFIVSPLAENKYENGYAIYTATANISHLNIHRIDTWVHRGGFLLNATFHRRKASIRGRNLTLAVLHDPPYVAFKNTSHGIEIGGLDIDVLNQVAEKLNFSYNVLYYNGTVYGNFINGTWTGLLGYLQRKEADFCLPSLSPTSLRNTVAGISAPVSSAVSVFLIRHPQTILDFHAFIAPFSPTTWLFLLGCSGVFCVLFTVTRLTNNGHHYVLCQLTDSNTSNVNDLPLGHAGIGGQLQQAIMSCVCFITQRGFEPFPEETSSRIMLTTLFILCMVLMGCYNSVLVALLAVDPNKMPFDSMESLLQTSDYKVGYVKGSAYEELLRKKSKCDNSDVFNNLYEKVMLYTDNVVSSNEQGIKKAYKDKYAFFSWVDGLIYEIGQNCSFVFVTGKYLLRNYGISFLKNSPFIEEVSIEILKLRETGVLMKLHQKYFPPQTYCTQEKITKPLGFKHILPVFVILLGGLITSLVGLSIEFIFFNIKCILNSGDDPKFAQF